MDHHSEGDDDDGSRHEAIAEWAMKGPLALAVGLLCLWELATWAPNYLTWPLWADHDVFSTAARAWQGGMLPYRDFRGNNFPGTIYLFWAFGKLFGFGWAQGPALYGFDVSLVIVFGATLLAWSLRRFGRALPGLAGFGGFLGYYLALDYSQAAQRDWHGPVLAIVGTLLAQAFPGRTSRLVAALLTAFGLIIRPQAILLLPAQAWVVGGAARSRDRSAIAAVAEWGIVLAAGVGLGFLPLVLAGVWPDFLKSLKVVSYGNKYNLVSGQMFLEQFSLQLQPLRVDIVPIGILLLARRSLSETRRAAFPWALAFLGVLLYRPLTPILMRT